MINYSLMDELSEFYSVFWEILHEECFLCASRQPYYQTLRSLELFIITPLSTIHTLHRVSWT